MEDSVPCIPTVQQWMLWVALIVSMENKFAPKVSHVSFFLNKKEMTLPIFWVKVYSFLKNVIILLTVLPGLKQEKQSFLDFGRCFCIFLTFAILKYPLQNYLYLGPPIRLHTNPDSCCQAYLYRL